MTMESLRNQMAAAAQMAAAGRIGSRIGVVSSYDPGTASARVFLQPQDDVTPTNSLTGWLPVASPWVGNGWGMDAPVSPGDQVVVAFMGGELQNGVIVARLYSDGARPTGAVSGEMHLMHASGTLLKFNADGTVTLVSQGTLTSTAPQWNHTGPVKITGNVLITGTETVQGQIVGQNGLAISGANSTVAGANLVVTGGNLIADSVDLKNHVHSGVQTGTGNTGAAQG